jgi:hypothetical protein
MSLYKYKNSKVWWMDFIFDGVRVRESTKSRSKKLAEDIARKRRTDLESGRMGLKTRERPRLFSLVAEDYLKVKQPVLSERGLIIERSNLKHLLRAFGGKLLSDINAAEIGAYQRDRISAGAAPKTANLELGTRLTQTSQWAASRRAGRLRARGPRSNAASMTFDILLALVFSRGEFPLLYSLKLWGGVHPRL